MLFASVIFGAGLYKDGSPVKLLRNEADLAYGADHTVVEFFAPWCGHCQRFAPAYEYAAEQLATEHVPSLTVAAVDCAAEPELCSTYSVSSYPTIILLPEKQQYHGAKEAEPLVAWVRKQLAGTGAADDAAAEAPPSVAVPPLARRPHTDTVAAADVLAAARHSLSHVVAAALPVHEGEGGDLDEQGLLQLMQGDDSSTSDEEGGGGSGGQGGGQGGGRRRGHGRGHAEDASATDEGEFLPSRPENSWGDRRRRALLNWLAALEARCTHMPCTCTCACALYRAWHRALRYVLEAATLCIKAGLPRDVDGGATAAAAARLRRLLTEETVGLPTQAELST